jgi:hypothetical protein
MDDLLKINAEYMNKYPNAESLLNGFHTFGVDGLLKIYYESKGREIVFITLDGEDNIIYSFK